jgi:hypothetical protein
MMNRSAAVAALACATLLAAAAPMPMAQAAVGKVTITNKRVTPTTFTAFGRTSVSVQIAAQNATVRSVFARILTPGTSTATLFRLNRASATTRRGITYYTYSGSLPVPTNTGKTRLTGTVQIAIDATSGKSVTTIGTVTVNPGDPNQPPPPPPI